MGFIPHPPLPLAQVRPTDIWLLLGAGAIWELVHRMATIWTEVKPRSLRTREFKLEQLQYEANQKRQLGPSAFVETSKLERQVLAEEKALSELYQTRKERLAKLEKRMKKVGLALSFLVFFLYLGIPIIQIEGSKLALNEILSEEAAAKEGTAWMKAFLFPLSYIAVGLRVSRWGLDDPQNSIGALIVFWSAQATAGKIMEGVEALLI